MADSRPGRLTSRIRESSQRLLLLPFRSPFCYLSIYLAVVVAYAIIYCLNSTEFRHPYLRHEPEVFRQRSILRDELTLAFRKAVAENADISEDVFVDVDTIRVTANYPADDATPDNPVIVVKLRLTIVRKEPRIEMHTLFALRVKRSGYMKKKDEEEFLLSVEREVINKSNFDAQIWGIENVEEQAFVKVQMLRVDRDTHERYIRILNAFEGIAYDIPGNWLRMLYFSVVTITTLGYGDIVPVTTKARILIGSESLIGIVLLGFFINAAWSRTRSRSTDATAEQDIDQSVADGRDARS